MIGSYLKNTRAKLNYYLYLNFIFTTVTDTDVWSRLENMRSITKKFICRCSGSLWSDIFINADMSNIFICSIYPKSPSAERGSIFSELSQNFLELRNLLRLLKNWQFLL